MTVKKQSFTDFLENIEPAGTDMCPKAPPQPVIFNSDNVGALTQPHQYRATLDKNVYHCIWCLKLVSL